MLDTDKPATRAKIITPKTSNVDEGQVESNDNVLEGEKLDTFVPLLSTETLINTISFDLDNDSYDDEVIVVRKAGSDYLWIVPGIYNTVNKSYERLAEISTKIVKTRTFTYSGIDLIGDHRNELVFYGTDELGNYVMQIFLCEKNNDENELVKIGDFSSNGTIFIQQVERSDSYELSLSTGESYSIWVYKSEEKDEKADGKTATEGSNQIRQEYRWNSSEKQYVLYQEITETARRIAAKELSRIQDGTVETFAAFLNGLWYKTSNTESDIRYIFFDYEDKEIIFLFSDTQEVYEWDESKIRHDGIYITTVNSSISNLHRRFDILLSSVDEIKVTVRDDVNMDIREKTLWDGQYKKMNQLSDFSEDKSGAALKNMVSEIETGPEWISSDNLTTISFSDDVYNLKSQDYEEDGIYSFMYIGDYNVLELKSNTTSSTLNNYYSVTFGEKIVTSTVKRKTVQTSVVDYDKIFLIPVKITPTDCYVQEGRTLELTRNIQKQ